MNQRKFLSPKFKGAIVCSTEALNSRITYADVVRAVALIKIQEKEKVQFD
jgi:hypothetical protein